MRREDNRDVRGDYKRCGRVKALNNCVLVLVFALRNLVWSLWALRAFAVVLVACIVKRRNLSRVVPRKVM